MLTEVHTGALDIQRLARLAGRREAGRVRAAAARGCEELAGRAVINVNSTARGGGVAEMLLPLVAYARGAGIDCRWLVIGGDPAFFAVTKRIHNRLHGVQGDGGPLGDEQRAIYERGLEGSARELLAELGPSDVVILHDPQTAGLAPVLAAAGNPVIWRCHVGIDDPNELARSAWHFLEPYIERADRVVFSRRQFAWDVVEPARRAIIAPSIDALSPKNQELAEGTAAAILEASGLRAGASSGAAASFVRLDGSRATVRRRAELDEDAPLRPADRYVLQVSRWDRLKDPLGVIAGFATQVAPMSDAHLVYAGPDVGAVSDDPEGAEILRAARALRLELPPGARARIHLAVLPMEDLQENAAIVNALQRCASVVVQKSLAEGFGLTVAEAMWKGRPVVASRVGGIGDQIEHRRSGLLLDNPSDTKEYAAAVLELLEDPAGRERARRRGARAGTNAVPGNTLADGLPGRDRAAAPRQGGGLTVTETERAPLGGDELRLIDAYWRAANYLSVGQIYLLDNPLLREPLSLQHVKPRLLGHWGTTPGLNLLYAHMNRAIRERGLNAIYVTGPGHGGPGLVANTYLEGTYSEVYPQVGEDEEGLRRLFHQFSFPGGSPLARCARDPGLDPRGWRARLRARARLRGGIRQPRPARSLRGRRRRGRDRPARRQLALEQVPQSRP